MVSVSFSYLKCLALAELKFLFSELLLSELNILASCVRHWRYLLPILVQTHILRYKHGVNFEKCLPENRITRKRKYSMISVVRHIVGCFRTFWVNHWCTPGVFVQILLWLYFLSQYRTGEWRFIQICFLTTFPISYSPAYVVLRKNIFRKNWFTSHNCRVMKPATKFGRSLETNRGRQY